MSDDLADRLQRARAALGDVDCPDAIGADNLEMFLWEAFQEPDMLDLEIDWTPTAKRRGTALMDAIHAHYVAILAEKGPAS